jgi:hypothetical protein
VDVRSEPYREASFSVGLGGEPHRVDPDELAAIVIRIVEKEGPIHEEEIARRVTTLWGLQRTGSRISDAVGRALRSALRRRALVKEDRYFYIVANRPVTSVRDRSQALSPGLRRPEMIPPSEIRYAIDQLVSVYIRITANEMTNAISRLLGFKMTSAQSRAIIEREIERLIASGELVEASDDSGGLSKPILH